MICWQCAGGFNLQEARCPTCNQSAVLPALQGPKMRMERPRLTPPLTASSAARVAGHLLEWIVDMLKAWTGIWTRTHVRWAHRRAQRADDLILALSLMRCGMWSINASRGAAGVRRDFLTQQQEDHAQRQRDRQAGGAAQQRPELIRQRARHAAPRSVSRLQQQELSSFQPLATANKAAPQLLLGRGLHPLRVGTNADVNSCPGLAADGAAFTHGTGLLGVCRGAV